MDLTGRSGVPARRTVSPTRTATRLLAAAADQLGQALRPRPARCARRGPPRSPGRATRSNRRYSSPSRTICARRWRQFGPPRDPCDPTGGLATTDQQESADAIDREVEYLNRLVTNLLRPPRIEAGALRAEIDAFELDDLVTDPRAASSSARGSTSRGRAGCPAGQVDPIFLDEAVTNVIENAIKYTPAGTGYGCRRAILATGSSVSRSRTPVPASPPRPASALREVLPRPWRSAGIPLGNGDRPRRCGRPGRGDGRPSPGRVLAALACTWICAAGRLVPCCPRSSPGPA